MNKTIQVNRFKDMYFEYKDVIEDESQAMSRDLSEDIEPYIEEVIDSGALVTIQLRGEPGVGKSVLGLELKRRTNKRLNKIHRKEINEYEWIASDQIEFTRLQNKKEENVCLLVDEFSALGRTGVNATTEQAQFEFISDVMRVEYKHRIMCSPITIIDKNANLIIDVIDSDKKNGLTYVQIIYRNPMQQRSVIIGSAWIDVNETLQSEWYRKYEKKKRARIGLFKDYNVRDVRELELDCLALEVIHELKDIAETDKVDLVQVRCEMKNCLREKSGQLISIFAGDDVITDIHSVLHNMYKFNKSKKEKARKIIKRSTEKILNRLYKSEKALQEYTKIE